VRLEGLHQLKKSNDLIGNRTRDLPVGNAGVYVSKFGPWGPPLLLLFLKEFLAHKHDQAI
jgi:hypothetical protein